MLKLNLTVSTDSLLLSAGFSDSPEQAEPRWHYRNKCALVHRHKKQVGIRPSGRLLVDGACRLASCLGALGYGSPASLRFSVKILSRTLRSSWLSSSWTKTGRITGGSRDQNQNPVLSHTFRIIQMSNQTKTVILEGGVTERPDHYWLTRSSVQHTNTRAQLERKVYLGGWQVPWFKENKSRTVSQGDEMEQDVFGPVMTISDSLLMSVLIKSYNKKVYFCFKHVGSVC